MAQGKEEERSTDSVYLTVLHEFAHDLGLGHAFNTDGDLMCSVEENVTVRMLTHVIHMSTSDREPSDMDVKAMLAQVWF